jgi:arginine decarboxylase
MTEPPERPIVPLPNSIVIANPIPYEFYRTTGTGQSPYQQHAGSYHDAMRNARVELGNIIAYTSILPSIAKEIPIQQGAARLRHGSELKVIQAAAHVDLEKGEKSATAAILYGWLIPKNKRNAKHAGGLVCEYNGAGSEKEAIENLRACLNDLYQKPNPDGYSFSKEYKLKVDEPLVARIEPTVRYGTALAALAFVSFVVPVINHNVKGLSQNLEQMVEEKIQ